jgi:hypothetical protein
VPFVAVVIMLGINDYMDSKEKKTKRKNYEEDNV